MHNYLRYHRFSILLFIVTIIAATALLPTYAQTTSLNLTQTAEYDIGFDCPVSSVLDPTGVILWVLMDNCGEFRYSLHAYDVLTGEQVNDNDYTDSLTMLDGMYVDVFITALGLTPSGDLSIRYNDPETGESINILIPITSGGEVALSTSSTYDELLASYSDYPDYSIYSPDHSKVIAIGASSFYVIDVQTETEIAEIPVEDTTDMATAFFSLNGEHVYVIHYDSEDDIASTLFIYDLATLQLLGEYKVPSSAVWVSPDEKYVAANFFSFNIGDLNELVIYDLETGLTSPAVNLNEDPAPVSKCLNTGNDMSDVNFIASGRFSFSAVLWLPDSSNMVLALSYGGESAGGGGTPCIFNYSRLGTYTVD